MNNFSLIEKINILMDIIVSSPLFLACCMLGVAILIFFIISIKVEKKVNKWFFISVWAILILILIINYNSIFLNLIDSLFDALFMALYFPNFATYIAFLCVSNFSFFYSLFNKRVNKKYKITNFIFVLLINILLLFIVDIVSSEGINIYDLLSIYANSNLMVLLQLTSALFTSWILVILLISAHNKLKKYDEVEKVQLPEIIFEDI